MKKNGKIIILGLVTANVLLNSLSVFADNNNKKTVKISINNINATVNNTNTKMDVAPYIQQGTNSTMIPLRFVSTALGIDENNIKFDSNTKIITITKDSDVVEFQVGSNGYKKNGTWVKNNKSKTEIKDGRTFVPFRVLGEAFDLDVDWDSNTKTAILIDDDVNDKNDLDDKNDSDDKNDKNDLDDKNDSDDKNDKNDSDDKNDKNDSDDKDN